MKLFKATIVLVLVLGYQSFWRTSQNPFQSTSAATNYQTGNYRIYLPFVIKSKPPMYNRVAAVAHADQYAHDRSDDYPKFGTGCSCNDCTNYASQVLHRGGYPLKEGNWDEDSPFEWWHKKTLLWFSNSKTWSATDWFNTFVHQYQEYEFEISTDADEMLPKMMPGDFIILDLRNNETNDIYPDGIPDHVRVVVGYGYTSTNSDDYGCQSDTTHPPSTYVLLVNQHCVDRQHVAWDYNLRPETETYWFIHVKW